MVWTFLRQQQQCGAQLPNKARRPGEAPAAAVEDRAAQDHEQAGETLQPGDYPASDIAHRDQDPSTTLRTGNTPTAADPRVQWDEVVQPERRQQEAGETELEEDQRGEDAEQVPDAQAEQALRQTAMDEDGERDDEAGWLDRND